MDLFGHLPFGMSIGLFLVAIGILVFLAVRMYKKRDQEKDPDRRKTLQDYGIVSIVLCVFVAVFMAVFVYRHFQLKV